MTKLRKILLILILGGALAAGCAFNPPAIQQPICDLSDLAGSYICSEMRARNLEVEHLWHFILTANSIAIIADKYTPEEVHAFCERIRGFLSLPDVTYKALVAFLDVELKDAKQIAGLLQREAEWFGVDVRINSPDLRLLNMALSDLEAQV